MVRVFFTGHSMLENSSEANAMRTGMEVDGVSVFGNFPGSKISAFAPAVNYCRRMLLTAALEQSDTPLTIDADWERQLDVLIRTDKKSRQTMKSYIKTVNEDSIEIYLNAALEGMLRNDGNGLEDCGRCFVEVASMTPSSIVGRLCGRAAELLAAIKSNNVATRFLAAQAFGILAAHPAMEGDSLQRLVQSLLFDIQPWESAVGADANKVHGSILGLGYITSRASYYGSIGTVEPSIVQEAITLLLAVLVGARDNSTREAVFSAIGQMSASGIITAEYLDESNHKTGAIIEVLAAEAKKGNEKAISALGRLAIVFEEETDAKPDGPSINHNYNSLRVIRAQASGNSLYNRRSIELCGGLLAD